MRKYTVHKQNFVDAGYTDNKCVVTNQQGRV